MARSQTGSFDVLKFSANISTLFTESTLLERIDCARRAGFDGIEIQFPYDIDAHELKAALDDSDMPLVLCNLPAGDLLAGGEGDASIPERRSEFEASLELACDYARILRPRAMNLLSGCPDATRDRAICLQVFAANLAATDARLRKLGIKLVTEAINTLDQPGFLLSRARQVVELIERLPQVEFKLQFDLYHTSRMGDDPAQLLAQYIARIGHIQFADDPGRGEPGSGALDFDRLFGLIDALPYNGFVGAEYFPGGNTRDSLEWLWRQHPESGGRWK